MSEFDKQTKPHCDIKSSVASSGFLLIMINRFIKLLTLAIALLIGSTASSQTTWNIVPGWNLLGNNSIGPLPVTYPGLSNPDQTNSIWTWNAATSKWSFYAPSLSDTDLTAYAQSKGYEVLSSIASKQGFWISANSAFSVTSSWNSNATLAASDITLGWSLVGGAGNSTPPQLNQSLRAGLNAAGKDVSAIWAWDTESSTWRFYAPSLETQGGTALSDYISTQGYKPFITGISSSDGVWVNTSYTAPYSVPIVPRPGIVKGVFTMDVGGWMPGTYARGLFEPTYDRILSQVGGNLVAISDPVKVIAYDAAKATVTMSKFESPGTPGTYGMLTREQYRRLVSAAHGRNLAFMLQLGIYGTSTAPQLPWSVDYSNIAFWDAWFAAYKPIVLEYADIARELDIEYLSLGMNHGFMSHLPVKYWSDLVTAIRSVGYTGKLVYQAGVGFQYSTGEFMDFNGGWIGTESERQAKRLEFVKLFDAIILNVYNIALDRTTPRSISRDEMKQSFRWLLAQVNGYPVPLMVMVGTPSVYGGAVDPEYIEPCLVCGSVAANRQRDDMQQADVYEALSEVVNETPTGTGNIMGVLSWGYWYTDDYYTWTNEWGVTADMAYDKSANVRGKLAEVVLKWWFDRW